MGVGGGRLDGLVSTASWAQETSAVDSLNDSSPPQLEGREFTPRIISLDRDVDPASPKSLLQSGS
jgi:hypothetical protein